MFIPTKQAARNSLESFIPKCGSIYSAYRNYDREDKSNSTVSRFSPWIRNRTLPEWEVIDAVLKEHSATAASKFIDEVLWRTYWKGWLQLRPSIWKAYQQDLAKLCEPYSNHSKYTKAIESLSGIDCFDIWNRELIDNNYLHNHARMWYASIWIHTLKLPWQLGADWFLRNLFDGDPASNTLSWRWVAGLHTQGKSYLARRDNILKYTENRFEVDVALANEAIDVEQVDHPSPIILEEFPPIPKGKRLGILITLEDLSAIDWLDKMAGSVAQAGYFPLDAYKKHNMAPSVIKFHQESMINQMDKNMPLFIEQDAAKVLEWIKAESLDGIIIAEPPIGPTQASLKSLVTSLEPAGTICYWARHWWDATLYPYATHGFFRFKKAIPSAITQLKVNLLKSKQQSLGI